MHNEIVLMIKIRNRNITVHSLHVIHKLLLSKYLKPFGAHVEKNIVYFICLITLKYILECGLTMFIIGALEKMLLPTSLNKVKKLLRLG